MQSAIQVSKLNSALNDRQVAALSLSEVFYMATKLGGSFFGKVGSFEVGYEFDALVIDNESTWHDSDTINDRLYTRLERFIYHGNVHQIKMRFCQGKEIFV
jgi:guanine deaminase